MSKILVYRKGMSNSLRFTRRQMLRQAAGAALTLGCGSSMARLWAQNPKANDVRGVTGGVLAKPKVLFPREALDFLRAMTRDVVQAARVKPDEKRGGSATNTTGSTLIMPGGNYPAFWMRDFALSLDSGFITAEEMGHHLRLAARCQNGPAPRPLKNGLVIPPFAIPDHINFDGSAAFYPGTYASGEDQGNGTYGFLPPVDDHYEFIHIADRLYHRTRQTDFLKESVNGLPLLERLLKAFEAPATDPVTELVVTQAKERAVGFGFCDSVYFTGAMLFPSLLRYRAAGQLLELCRAVGQTKLDRFNQAREGIASNLAPTFGEPSRIGGWLLASTLVGRQPDVWGTLYALHLGALREDDARRARATIAEAVKSGIIALEGAVRHVPTDLDASPTSAWEKAACAHNTYQNGAYWHTPTGWLIEALAREHRPLAERIFQEYIQHLRQGDYRLGGKGRAPWECFGRNGKAAQNGVYMTSVALPWAVIQSLAG